MADRAEGALAHCVSLMYAHDPACIRMLPCIAWPPHDSDLFLYACGCIIDNKRWMQDHINAHMVRSRYAAPAVLFLISVWDNEGAINTRLDGIHSVAANRMNQLTKQRPPQNKNKNKNKNKNTNTPRTATVHTGPPHAHKTTSVATQTL
jgi:hypothetical protein